MKTHLAGVSRGTERVTAVPYSKDSVPRFGCMALFAVTLRSEQSPGALELDHPP